MRELESASAAERAEHVTRDEFMHVGFGFSSMLNSLVQVIGPCGT